MLKYKIKRLVVAADEKRKDENMKMLICFTTDKYKGHVVDSTRNRNFPTTMPLDWLEVIHEVFLFSVATDITDAISK